MKEKREPRKDLVKKVDMFAPLNIEILGSANDPCFGKLFNPGAEECQRCGDSEICSAVMGQASHIQRAQIESKSNFKDLEEDKIPDLDKAEMKKKIKSRFREVIKLSPKGISEERLIADVHATFSTQGFSKPKLKKILDALTSKTNKFTFNPKTQIYSWKR